MSSLTRRLVILYIYCVFMGNSVGFGRILKQNTSSVVDQHTPSITNASHVSNKTTTTSTTTSTKAMPTTISTQSYALVHFNKTWNCTDIKSKKTRHTNTSIYVYYTDLDPYVCNLNPLHCKRPDHPSGGDKNTLALYPKYGDYKYLPISQWILLLQHGAVAFLYHPCTTKDNIEKLQNIAKKCMRRHVITPYEHLNISQPIAMVAWASYYADSKVNESASESWIKNNAMKGPASHVLLNGEYNVGLTQSSHVVSDPDDSMLCPKQKIKATKQEQDIAMLDQHYKVIHHQGHSSKKLKKELIQHLKQNLKPTKRHMDTKQAAWAVGSLLFLCVILVVVLMYTKPWNERDYYLKEKMVASRNNNSGFTLLKTQLRRGHKSWREMSEQHRHAASKRRLLGPINEEEEDFMDL